MMVGKEDLGLSLSLGPDSNQNMNHPPTFLINPFFHQKPQWSNLAASGITKISENERRPNGIIDVNRVPAASEEEEEEVAPCSPNSTVSSIMSGGGKRDHHHQTAEEIIGGVMSDEDDGDGSRKKLRLSKDQSAVLEETFKEHNTLNPKQKLALAKQLNLRARQVEVWFQNRRARTKLKQTEVDCDFMKRCCENLTEENRRLQKEVQELRALKLISPQLYMHMTPPTTLTMCPSCQRISSTTSPHAAAADQSNHSHHRHHYQRRLVAPTGEPWPPVPLRASFPPTQIS